MSDRITYGGRKLGGRRFLWVIPLLGLLAMLAAKNLWYADLARYVGEAIRGH